MKDWIIAPCYCLLTESMRILGSNPIVGPLEEWPNLGKLSFVFVLSSA